MDRATRVCLVVAAVWLGGLLSSSSARAQAAPAGTAGPEMTVALDLTALEIREGEPLPLRCTVDVKDERLVDDDLCVTLAGRFLADGDEDPAITGTRDETGMADQWEGLWKKGYIHRMTPLRSWVGPIKAVGPQVLEFDPSKPSAQGVGPIYAPPGRGRFQVSVWAGWKPRLDSASRYRTYDQTMVKILPAEKKLAARFEIEGGNTVRVGQQFWIRLTLDIEGLTGDPKQTTDFQIRSTLRQTPAPAGQKPASITKTGKVTAAHSSGGKLRVVKRWYGTAWTVGDREVDAEVSAPGFAPLTRTETIRVEGDPVPAAPATVPAPAVAPLYILDQVEDDPDKLIDKQLHLGKFTNVSRAAVGMMHDVPPPWSGATFAFKVGGAPPATLKPGDTFQMSVSATGVQQREQPNKAPAIYNAGCGIKVAGPLELTATPHTGFEIIDGGEGTGTCAGGFTLKGQEGRQWVASDSRTYTFTVQEGRADDPPVVACYIGGFGAFARYRYRQFKEGEPIPADNPPAEPDKPPQALEAEDEAPPLEAWLEPETVETTPRSGLYARTEIRVRGVKPNAAPVEVIYDTTDARGTLAMNPYLKVEGSGSRETGDMWQDNQGSVPWGLNVGANLGIAYGTYGLPITVRQRDHGEVQLRLMIRVLPRGDAASPATGVDGAPVSYAQSGRLEARLESPSLDLNAGGLSAANAIFVRGADSARREPIEIAFPQMAAKGALPGGILVDPGTTQAHPNEKWAVEVLDQPGWLPFGQTFRATSDAPAGISLIDVVVRQKGVGETLLRLQIAVRRRDTPLLPEGRPTQPAPTTGDLQARVEPNVLRLKPGAAQRQVVLYIRGWRGDVADRVEVEIPQADANGRTPEGVDVYPPSFSRPPGDLVRGTPEGESLQGFSISVRGDARPGTVTLLFRVRQGRYGESTVPLTVLIGAGAPGAPATAPAGSGGRAPAAGTAGTAASAGVSAADRNQAAARLAKAVELLAAGKHAAAEVELRASILLNPTADDAWMNLGEACMQQAKWPAAVAAFRQAVVLQPEDPLYRADLAQALLKQGNRSEAVAEAKESLRLGMEKDVHPIFKELGL